MLKVVNNVLFNAASVLYSEDHAAGLLYLLCFSQTQGCVEVHQLAEL